MPIKVYNTPPTQPKVTARVAAIQKSLDNRKGCTCEIRADMTDDELMAVKSCQPRWVCSTLDSLRRRWVDYTLPEPKDEDDEGG